MYDRRFPLPIAVDDLKMLARQASSDHLTQGTDLTDAVVKAASLFDRPLTAEHVRRVCEMTYHDVFERKFRNEGGSDRYVSFDPPHAKIAAERLQAQKIASIHTRRAAMLGAETSEKVASARTFNKYRRVNAFDETIKEAGVAHSEVSWLNPAGELCHIQQDLRDAVRTIRTEIDTLSMQEKWASSDLFTHAVQAHKSGFSASRILEACFTSLGDAPHAEVKIASAVAQDLAENMARVGCALAHEKVASMATVNPNHPLPKLFRKTAEFRGQRMHLEYALSELQTQLERVNRELHELCAS